MSACGGVWLSGWNASESQHPKTSVPHKTALPETQKTIGQDFGMHPAETGIWISANQTFLNEMTAGDWNLRLRRQLNLATIKYQVSGPSGWYQLFSTGVAVTLGDLTMSADLMPKTIVQRQSDG